MTRLLPAERAALVKARVDADALERGLLRGAVRSAALTLLSRLRTGEAPPRRALEHDAVEAAFIARGAGSFMGGGARAKLSQRAIPGLNRGNARAGAR